MLESDHALAPIAHALDIERVQIDHNDWEQLPSVEGLRNLDTNREDIRNAACSTSVSYTRQVIHAFITLKDGWGWNLGSKAVGTGKYSLPFKSIADRFIVNLDIVHDYNLPSVAIRLLEVPRESEIQ